MIKLEQFAPTDFDRLIAWIDSPEALMQFGGPTLSFPLTADQLHQSLHDPNRHVFKVVETTTEDVVGHGEIYHKEDGATYLVRLLIGDLRARGKGLGTLLTHHLLAYAFDILKRTVVHLLVFDWNTTAIHVYQKVGFRVVPNKQLLRKVNGKQWTAITMVIRREDWRRPEVL